MKQPIRNNNKINKNKKDTIVTKTRKVQKNVKKHPQYGTSKLEEDFARDFLDKLDLKYEYQFEAKDIKRFFDFNVQGVLIEIDGDYW